MIKIKNYLSHYWISYGLVLLGLYSLYRLEEFILSLACFCAALSSYIFIFLRKRKDIKKFKPEAFYKAPSFIVSKSGKIIRYNEEAKEITQTLGKSIIDLFILDGFNDSDLFGSLNTENKDKNNYIKSDNIIYVTRFLEKEKAFLINRYDRKNYPYFFENNKKSLNNKNEELSQIQNKLNEWVKKDPQLQHFLKTHGSNISKGLSGDINEIFEEVRFFDPETKMDISFHVMLKPEKDNIKGVALPSKPSKLKQKNINRNLYDSVFQDSPSAIVITDKKGIIDNYNKAFSELIDNLTHDNIYKYFSSDDKSKIHYCIDHKIKQEVFIKVDDKPKPVSVDIKKIFENNNQQYIFYIVDMSEEKDLENKFNQVQKMQAIGQLAGGVAHDFNNLLTAILGHTEILLERLDPTDNSFKDLKQIEHNSHRAGKLVKQLLAFSRQQTLHPKIINLMDILPDINDLLRRLMGENIAIKTNYGQNLKSIKMDVTQLEQVILNLAVNAKDAMDSNGVFTIKTLNISKQESVSLGYDIMAEGEYIAIYCSDNGHGMDNEMIRKVFEPFFTTKDIGEGTGLGLSTVYGIIKQSEGFIFVESEQNKGTCFKIYLPAYENVELKNQEEEKQDVKKQSAAPHTKKILIAEDETSVRELIISSLEMRGYNVIAADCGEEALEIFKNEFKTIDLILSDVMMPGMDGPSWVKQALKVKDDIKIIFMSGYAEDSFREDPALSASGANALFLAKPFTLKSLTKIVKDSF